jgi:hypothetical protein
MSDNTETSTRAQPHRPLEDFSTARAFCVDAPFQFRQAQFDLIISLAGFGTEPEVLPNDAAARMREGAAARDVFTGRVREGRP